MNMSTRMVLLATIATTGAWAQDFSVESQTFLQVNREEAPGLDEKTYLPATQFLGIDASRLGTEALSLHLFGWGYKDFKESTTHDGSKSGGDLSYAYLEYRFNRANAQLKAGRFAVSQGAGIDQVDGVSGRTDLRGGFSVSGFVGAPGALPDQPGQRP